MIHNPILPGFHADPCICRKGDDFYVAVSSFEWFPGIPIYHSKDMKNWELYSHALTNADDSDWKNCQVQRESGSASDQTMVIIITLCVPKVIQDIITV